MATDATQAGSTTDAVEAEASSEDEFDVGTLRDAKRLLEILKVAEAGSLTTHADGSTVLPLNYSVPLNSKNPFDICYEIMERIEKYGFSDIGCCFNANEDGEPIIPLSFLIDFGETGDAEYMLEALQRSVDRMISDIDSELKKAKIINTLASTPDQYAKEQIKLHDSCLRVLNLLIYNAEEYHSAAQENGEDPADALVIDISDLVERDIKHALVACEIVCAALQDVKDTSKCFMPAVGNVTKGELVSNTSKKMYFFTNPGFNEDALEALSVNEPILTAAINARVHGTGRTSAYIC